MSRPRPVLIVTLVLAALGAVTGFGGLADLIPLIVVKWLMLVYAVATATGGVYLHSVVTPLSSPQAADGRRLVPVPPARVPEHATRRDLDAT